MSEIETSGMLPKVKVLPPELPSDPYVLRALLMEVLETENVKITAAYQALAAETWRRRCAAGTPHEVTPERCGEIALALDHSATTTIALIAERDALAARVALAEGMAEALERIEQGDLGAGYPHRDEGGRPTNTDVGGWGYITDNYDDCFDAGVAAGEWDAAQIASAALAAWRADAAKEVGNGR